MIGKAMTNLSEHIIPQIYARLVPNLDPANMQVINDTLNLLRVATGRSTECQNAKVGIFCHEETNDLGIRVGAGGFVGFVWETALVFEGWGGRVRTNRLRLRLCRADCRYQ